VTADTVPLARNHAAVGDPVAVRRDGFLAELMQGRAPREHAHLTWRDRPPAHDLSPSQHSDPGEVRKNVNTESVPLALGYAKLPFARVSDVAIDYFRKFKTAWLNSAGFCNIAK
jgi:hypothetical protein